MIEDHDQKIINLVGYVDITDNKDGGVMKKIIEQGFGSFPIDGLELTVHYTSTLEDGRGVDNTYVTKEPYIFKLGCFSLIPGLEIAIKNMKMGERASVRIAPEYSFLAQEKLKNGEMPQNEFCIKDLIYPHSYQELTVMDVQEARKFMPVIYEIYLEKFDKPRKHKSQMITDEKITEATDLKSEGNILFSKKSYQEAIVKYKDAMDYLTKIPNDELNSKIFEIQQSCLLNIINCHICLSEYNYALKKLEEFFSGNKKTPTKFYYYRAIALMNMGEFDKSEKDIKKLSVLLPNDISVDKLKKDFIESKEKIFNKQKDIVKKGLFSSKLYEDKLYIGQDLLALPKFDFDNICFYLDILLNDNLKDPKKIKFEIFEHTSKKMHFLVDLIADLIKNKKLNNKQINNIDYVGNRLLNIETIPYDENIKSLLDNKENNIYSCDEDYLLVIFIEKNAEQLQVHIAVTFDKMDKNSNDDIIVVGRCYYNTQFLKNLKEINEKNEDAKLLIIDCDYTNNI